MIRSRKFTCYQRTLQMAAFPRYVVLVFLLLGTVIAGSEAAEAAKSAFGEAFDEIVVESTLTVRGKNPGRTSRNRAIAVETSTVGSSTTASAEAADVGEVKRTKRHHLEAHGPRIDTEGANSLHGASETYTTLLRSGFPAAAATVSLSRSGFSLDPGATSRGSHGKGASGAASVTITDQNGNTRNYYG